MPSRKRRSGSIITKGAKAASSSAADAVGQRSRKEGFFMLFSQEYYKKRRAGGKKWSPETYFPFWCGTFLVFRFFCGEWREKVAENFHSTFLGIGGASKCLRWRRKNYFPSGTSAEKNFFSFLFWHLKSFWPVKNCPRIFLGQKRLFFFKIRHFPKTFNIKKVFLQ